MQLSICIRYMHIILQLCILGRIRHPHRQRHTYTHTHSQTDRQADRQTRTQTGRHVRAPCAHTHTTCMYKEDVNILCYQYQAFSLLQHRSSQMSDCNFLSTTTYCDGKHRIDSTHTHTRTHAHTHTHTHTIMLTSALYLMSCST